MEKAIQPFMLLKCLTINHFLRKVLVAEYPIGLFGVPGEVRFHSLTYGDMKPQTVSNNGLRSFAGWLQEIGVSDVTGWRWKKRNWFSTRNISGRIYIEQTEIDRFLQRVRDGEFAKSLTVPQKGGDQRKQPNGGDAKEGSYEA